MDEKIVSSFNIYKLDIELLKPSFVTVEGKQECVLRLPCLEEAVSHYTGYSLFNRVSDNMAFRQARLILGISDPPTDANALKEYIVYVNAKTGRQQDMLVIIDTGRGKLVM